jgi:hypothetical protein
MARHSKGSSVGDDHEIGVVEAEFTEMSSADHTDIAHALYKESLEMDPIEREIIAKRVLRKLDFIVLPMVSHLPPLPVNSISNCS